jgi:hypothetical protein
MTWLDANRCWVLAVAVVLPFGCSDDGVPGQSDSSASAADGPGTGDESDGVSATASGTSTTDDGSSVSMTTSPTGPEDDTGEDATSGGDTDNGGSPAACESDRDCVVVDDCCTCAAQHVDDDAPGCPIDCVVGKCHEQNIPDIRAVCRFGTCVFSKVACDPSQVVCLALPPECPDGFLPSVEGSCWTGHCVPASACDVVPSCDHCEAHETCVELQTQLGPSHVCEPVAPACDGAPTCTCMGEACPEPWDTCADGPSGLECSCPAC